MLNLSLSFLGSPHVELDGKPVTIRRNKAIALLVYLAVSGEPQRRDTLATLLWPESSQNVARSSLRRELSLLNKTLGGNWLVTGHETVGLQPDIWLDVTQFKQYLTAGNTSSLASISTLGKAVALYRDDFLKGFTLPNCPQYDEWQFFQTESLRLALSTALQSLVAGLTDQRNYEAAISHARRWLALDPLHEPAHQTLMRLYGLSGRQAAAMRQFSECQRVLQEELGSEPDVETKELAVAIRERRLKPSSERTVALTRLNAIGDDERLGIRPFAEPRPPFVGRSTQLANLRQALEQTLGGQGQLRIIVGEAGAGKSALVSEFIHRSVAAQPDLLVARGYCDAQTGSVDPYLPFREALRALLLASEEGSPGSFSSPIKGPTPGHRSPQDIRDIACQAILDQGPQLLSVVASTSEIQSIITTARQAGWQGEVSQAIYGSQNLEQNRIFEQGAAVIQAVAAHFPLILVLEDLHWADSGSTGLLFRLARQLAGQTILVIGTYRPEAVRSSQHREGHPLPQMMLELQRNLSDIKIDLDDIRAVEGQLLVDGIIDAEPNRLNASFRQALYHHTGGHPLFVVELVQDLKSNGSLTQDEEGRWVIGSEIDWLSLPTRVEGAIAGRMAHLSEAQRWYLTIASVMGESFLVEVVAHVASENPRELTHILSHTLQAELRLVEAEGVERLDGQRLTHFRFSHNLMQVYLHSSLDEVQRVYLHEDVARALETLYQTEVERIALPLAYHYQAADMPQKAIDYLILASEKSLSSAALDEAGKHVRRALILLDKLPKSEARDRQELTAQTLFGRYWTASKGVAVPEVGAAYRRALELSYQLGETSETIRLLFDLAANAQMRLELAEAQSYGEECLRLAENNADPELQMQVNKILHNIAHSAGRHRDAVTHNDRVIAFYHDRRPKLTSEDEMHLAYALTKRGMNLVPCGYPDQALHSAQEGLRLMQRHGNQFNVAHCMTLISYIHLMRREWQAVMELTEKAIDITNQYGLVQIRTFSELNRGIAQALLGDLTAGTKLIQQAIAKRESINSPYGALLALTLLAEAYGRADRAGEGLTLINEVLAKVDDTNEREYEPEMYHVKGYLLLRQDPQKDQLAITRQEAEECFRQSVMTARSRETKLWEAGALASLCRLLHSQGRDEGCFQQLADLYAWFMEGFETEELRRVRSVLQEVANA